MIKAIILLYK